MFDPFLSVLNDNSMWHWFWDDQVLIYQNT